MVISTIINKFMASVIFVAHTQKIDFQAFLGKLLFSCIYVAWRNIIFILNHLAEIIEGLEFD